MKKQNENTFRQKFHLLNSQEHSDDIKWSSSSASDNENVFCDKNTLEIKRPRKRKQKQKTPNNLSNLDITVVNSCKDHEKNIECQRSPILKSKSIAVESALSPILTPICFPRNRKVDTISPVLSVKRCYPPKSPVLNLKTTSPNFSGRVKKKLCYEKSKTISSDTSVNKINPTVVEDGIVENVNVVFKNSETLIKSESNSLTINVDSDSSLKSKLVEKVKNYFDNNFSSENTSQNISDTPTPTASDSSKTEDVIILSCKTQSITKLQSIKFENVSNSDTSTYPDKSIKKVKYKRGGLAYRLNELLIKQNAHISLWQHERFLACNSNFVIPKEEYKAFHIQTLVLKYGCYLLYSLDAENKKYIIIIHKKYVISAICEESVLKLYKPYKVLSQNSGTMIIVNVCKFESVLIKS